MSRPTWLPKNNSNNVPVLSIGGSYDVIVYDWYSDNSVLLEDPAFNRSFTVHLRHSDGT